MERKGVRKTMAKSLVDSMAEHQAPELGDSTEGSTDRDPVDQSAIAAAVQRILYAIGEDPSREGLRDTPVRMARMYTELFSGLHQNPGEVLRTTFHETYDDVVLVRDISFFSMCEHHLLPFFGRAHVAYRPRQGLITGISKLARLVEGYARRPQVQERLTRAIVDTLVDRLDPEGALVVLQAEHLCMAMRGIQKPGTLTLTTAARGCFLENPEERSHLLRILGC